MFFWFGLEISEIFNLILNGDKDCIKGIFRTRLSHFPNKYEACTKSYSQRYLVILFTVS